jgi:hypothetical protein
MREAMEHCMSMRVVFCVSAICVSMIGATLAIGAGAGSAVAAAECLTEPNRDPPPGSHWYYRGDRTNDRKCWYLRALPAGTAAASASAAEAPRPAVGQAAQRRRAPLSESDEAALYLEFLRWKEQQRTAQ